LTRQPRALVLAAIEAELQAVRTRLRATSEPVAAPSLDALAGAVLARLAVAARPGLRRVLNATGIVLHTNLGRAPLADEALAQIEQVARGYSNVELDLETGERGHRHAHVEALLCRLTGAEAALVVNNNAAAVLLMLSALCAGHEVPVSRGELVEIGGSFRVPDVMVQGGARLIEVGTTNKTHLADYERACGPATAALLKVHTSNFRIVGFTSAPAPSALADLAHARGLPLLIDWGSGVLLDLAELGLAHEPTPAELLAQGADLVTFSGDKLLGAPQAGLLVGRRALVERCARHPLMRALRCDKLTLAGLEATLRLYLDPALARARVPALRLLGLQAETLRASAERLADLLRTASGTGALALEIVAGVSQAGGGALPEVELPTWLVAVSGAQPAHMLEARLRQQDPPVLARVYKDRLLLDPRTLADDELPLVARALARAMDFATGE
jgi:L-seryl-tRNA(Ser) seleniumtransferase